MKDVKSSLCFRRYELPVQLGFPLLGTVVEVRDTDGFRIQEGNGQVYLGCFIFIDWEFFSKKKSVNFIFSLIFLII